MMSEHLEDPQAKNEGGEGPGSRVAPHARGIPSTPGTPSPSFPLHIFPSVPNPDRTYLWYAMLHQRLREGDHA